MPQEFGGTTYANSQEEAGTIPSGETPVDDSSSSSQQSTPDPSAARLNALNKQIETYLIGRADKAEQKRKRSIRKWRRNIEMRIGDKTSGRDFSGNTGGVSDDGDLKAEVNPDWSLAKTKIAQLFSQVPPVQLTHDDDTLKQQIVLFAKAINKALPTTGIGAAMDECLADLVNAAGIAAIRTGYAERQILAKIPLLEPQYQTPEILAHFGGQVPMGEGPTTSDRKFFSRRVSPEALLIPSEFSGSDFEQSPWIGEDCEGTWPELKMEFGLRDSEQAELETGGNPTTPGESLKTVGDTQTEDADTSTIQYRDLYYRRYVRDVEEPYFETIWRLVIAKGREKPLYHGPWKCQKYDEQSKVLVGCRTYPIQVATLTYISDQAIPPSDTEANRVQVLDMRRSRAQMFAQRDRSVPQRWYNALMVDPDVAANLENGTYQGWIPTKGQGDKSFGEISRASYPSEDLAFDRQVQQDLDRGWSLGDNQRGLKAAGDQTATESANTQRNFSINIAKERANVTKLFLSSVKNLASLMALYSEFEMLPAAERQALVQSPIKTISTEVAYTIRPNAAILMAAEDRIKQLMEYLNMVAKSGYVDVEPVMVELTELHGLDPNAIVSKPKPPPQPPPEIRISMNGDDFANPIALAELLEKGVGPSPQAVQAAVTILQAVGMPFRLPLPPKAPGEGASASPSPNSAQGRPGSEGPAGGETPQPSDNEDWELAPKVATRSRELNAS